MAEHPNITLLSKLNPPHLAESAELFSQNFVWHFFNPELPDLQGDYFGMEGLQSFFDKLAVFSGGTFQVHPISLTPIGDELVVAHVKDRMTLQSAPIEFDVVVVWRIVDGLIAEAWDIPSLYTHYPQAIA